MPDVNVTFPEQIWAGSDQSLDIAREAHVRIMAGIFDRRDEPQEEPAPHNYELQGGVGIITIAGSLTNRDSPWNRYVGAVSYAEVRRALVHAVNDAAAKVILLDINSGGGAVSGLDDVATFIAQINKSGKKVYAFTDGSMMSAAYWLGSSAEKVYLSRTASLGSVGVIATHFEYSKALKEAGVGVTVMRTGEYKALVNSNEPLSEIAKRQLQDQLNATYQVFLGHVADARGMAVNIADQKIGQGREFLGEAAVAAGAADQVLSFDELMTKLSKSIDKAARNADNSPKFIRGEEMAGKVTLSADVMALIQAGQPLSAEQAAAVAAAVAQAQTTPQAEADPATTEASTETDKTTTTTAKADEVTESPKGNDIVAFLQTQVKELTEAKVSVQVELSTAKARIASLETTHAPLLKIAGGSLSTMKVALGSPALDLAELNAESVIAEHAAVTKKFNETFKVGGVAAVSATEATNDAAKNQPNSNHLARVSATRVAQRT